MDDYEGRCGSCAAFVRAYDHPEKGRVGECALEVFAPPLLARSTCTRYRPKGATAPTPRKRVPGEPRRAGGRATSAARESTSLDRPTPLRRELPKEIDIDMDIDEFRGVLREVLSEELGVSRVEIGQRWEGGEVVLIPGNTDTQEKRVSLDAFFHKIVMVRDKLRVLEQKINGHKGLSDADKVQLQSYITGCYGSLTTFNVLFENRSDSFSAK